MLFHSIVDLSHTLAPGIPIWNGDPEFVITQVSSIDSNGYALNSICFGEHSGTHIGSGAHWYHDGMTSNHLTQKDLCLNAVCIDISHACLMDPDYELSVEDILKFERQHGAIDSNTIVLLQTGWARYWNTSNEYFGYDHSGNMHFPGYSLESSTVLSERGVLGLGIDSPGIDSGMNTSYSVNRFWLQENRYHLENLTNLDLLPPTGIFVVVGALPIAHSTGAPARVFAFY